MSGQPDAMMNILGHYTSHLTPSRYGSSKCSVVTKQPYADKRWLDRGPKADSMAE